MIAFESGSDFIRVEFRDHSVYVYDATRPGADHVEQMKALTIEGRGLTTYINRHVREAFARRER